MIFLFDMGLPMIIPSMYLMVLGLIPVVIVETYVVAKELSLRAGTVIFPVAIANIISMFIGIPVTWFGLAFFEMVASAVFSFLLDNAVLNGLFAVTLGAAWVAPTGKDDRWIVLFAMLFLLIPYCAASWGIEYLVIRKKLGDRMLKKSTVTADELRIEESIEQKSLILIRRAILDANLFSYGLLALLAILIFTITITK